MATSAFRQELRERLTFGERVTHADQATARFERSIATGNGVDLVLLAR